MEGNEGDGRRDTTTSADDLPAARHIQITVVSQAAAVAGRPPRSRWRAPAASLAENDGFSKEAQATTDTPRDQFKRCAGLTTPAVITDADYRIVYIDASAEAFWRTTLKQVAGQYPLAALGLAPPDKRDLREWAAVTVFPALAAGDPFACRITDTSGRQTEIYLTATRFCQDKQWYVLVTVSDEAGALATLAPGWALIDPLTGLHNRHQWRRDFAERNAAAGTVLFFDLDDLSAIIDLVGHRVGGKALMLIGRVLAEAVPEGALLVRYGGDEFVMVVPAKPDDDCAALAGQVVTEAAAAAERGGFAFPQDLSFGLAQFAPGDLEGAVQRADEAMYERKGMLLRGKESGRIVLTRAGRRQVRRPGSDAEQPPPGTYAAGFGPEFESYFRQAFARAVEQAREFVAFAAPQAGQAVVEVATGSGRITFDGGLAERVGPEGQLLLTDPSAAQIQSARKRAHNLGLDWVRLLQAPGEDLPLASGTVEIVLGSTFPALHRPGGRHQGDGPARASGRARRDPRHLGNGHGGRLAVGTGARPGRTPGPGSPAAQPVCASRRVGGGIQGRRPPDRWRAGVGGGARHIPQRGGLDRDATAGRLRRPLSPRRAGRTAAPGRGPLYRTAPRALRRGRHGLVVGLPLAQPRGAPAEVGGAPAGGRAAEAGGAVPGAAVPGARCRGRGAGGGGAGGITRRHCAVAGLPCVWVCVEGAVARGERRVP